ncbi:MAG: 5-(carboxyamino)imidazole ribonucleotide synthase [Pirellulaceae bacterium]
MTSPILPGATVGVLGSGQLGRMFAVAARRMGYRVHVYSPDTDSPTGQLADREITASYQDLDAVADFARTVQVVTFEFENVPLETVQAVDGVVPVRPSGQLLHTTQNRLREKTFLRDNGFPVTPFCELESPRNFDQLDDQWFPAVIKTAAWGYDGKGQLMVRQRDDFQQWPADACGNLIVERLVDFQMELSVIGARGVDGQIVCYEPFENIHRHHILDFTLSPARVPPQVATEAKQIMRDLLASLDVVGVLCVEFFWDRNGSLLINELAPRPHNSGHLTVDAHVTCQFEQQVRAVCGLPLGSTRQHRPAAMANLLGDVWSHGTPNWPGVCGFDEVKLHLYGKSQPNPRRKMGHLTVMADSVDAALSIITQARQVLV